MSDRLLLGFFAIIALAYVLSRAADVGVEREKTKQMVMQLSEACKDE